MPSRKTDPILQVHNLNAWFGKNQILKDLTFDVLPKQVTAFIGPSNSGKTTLVRCFNRLNDLALNFKLTGKILYKGDELYTPKLKTSKISRQIGMVFQKPIPFRKSIYENVAYSAHLRGVKQPAQLDTTVEESLRKAQLWKEVYKDLHASPDILSNDQLDAAETPKLEAIVQSLKNRYTLIFVTNKRRQAARVSDVAGFLYDGELVEFGQTEQIFTNPKDKRTENYVTGRLG